MAAPFLSARLVVMMVNVPAVLDKRIRMPLPLTEPDYGNENRMSFVTRHAEELGWSWGYWQFDGDFIVYDMRSRQWVEPIRDAIVPRGK
jgi:hypothetical protein